MRAGWLLTRTALLTLIALRVVVGSLAEASPPDPTWIPGLYDEGDFDDIVDHLVSLASACDWAPAPTLSSPICGAVCAATSPPPVGASRIAPHDRAPPLS